MRVSTKWGGTDNASHTVCVRVDVCECVHTCMYTDMGVHRCMAGVHGVTRVCTPSRAPVCTSLLCWGGSEPGTAGAPGSAHSPSLPRGPRLCSVQ